MKIEADPRFEDPTRAGCRRLPATSTNSALVCTINIRNPPVPRNLQINGKREPKQAHADD